MSEYQLLEHIDTQHTEHDPPAYPIIISKKGQK